MCRGRKGGGRSKKNRRQEHRHLKSHPVRARRRLLYSQARQLSYLFVKSFRGALDKAAAAETEVAPEHQDLLSSWVPLLPGSRPCSISCGWGGRWGWAGRGHTPPWVDSEGVSATAGGPHPRSCLHPIEQAAHEGIPRGLGGNWGWGWGRQRGWRWGPGFCCFLFLLSGAFRPSPSVLWWKGGGPSAEVLLGSQRPALSLRLLLLSLLFSLQTRRPQVLL